MAGYEVLVDGSRVRRVGSDDELRAFLAKYRQEHRVDDPDAVHIQILARGPLSWLVGGKLVATAPFLERSAS